MNFFRQSQTNTLTKKRGRRSITKLHFLAISPKIQVLFSLPKSCPAHLLKPTTLQPLSVGRGDIGWHFNAKKIIWRLQHASMHEEPHSHTKYRLKAPAHAAYHSHSPLLCLLSKKAAVMRRRRGASGNDLVQMQC